MSIILPSTATHLDRLQSLRQVMQQAQVDAYIIGNNDPHLSEYLPDHWKCIEWLTGFTGEAASVVVTLHDAALWTDSRYFIQAADQLGDLPIRLMKMGLPGVPSLTEWLSHQLLTLHPAPLHIVGLDGRLFSAAEADDLRDRLVPSVSISSDAPMIMLRHDCRLFDTIWTDRPDLPQGALELYDASLSGEERPSRLERIRKAIGPDSSLLLTALDEVAWSFDVRGTDIACTPVVTAYGLITPTTSILFVDPAKVSDEVRTTLQRDGIEIAPYDTLIDYLQSCPSTGKIIAVPSTTSAAVMRALKAEHEEEQLLATSPIALMKAVKNEVELRGFASAMLKDGIALTRFLIWIEEELRKGTPLTEWDCVEKIKSLRSLLPGYREESFDAIVAWREHGALPHYSPSPQNPTTIEGNGLLLIDTGGQYIEGTTDVTRTLPIGHISDAERRDYTLVLCGHIRLALACFPVGTRGDQLDALARYDLWRDGKTYRHGTGHGVGHFLSVHEGPQSIRMQHNPTALLPGMVCSNEPAIYLEGRYGIRHENCLLVRPLHPATDCPDATPSMEGEFGDFLCFDNLTLCPIDPKGIMPELMTAEQLTWLDDYNRHVCACLEPHLTDAENAWLRSYTHRE